VSCTKVRAHTIFVASDSVLSSSLRSSSIFTFLKAFYGRLSPELVGKSSCGVNNVVYFVVVLFPG